MALPNQSSAFVPVTLNNILGVQPDGTVVSNLFAQAGRVVIVGEEPLLEITRTGSDQVQFDLYAPTDTTNRVEITEHLPPNEAWTLLESIGMTNLFHALPPYSVTNQSLFIRAIREE